MNNFEFKIFGVFVNRSISDRPVYLEFVTGRANTNLEVHDSDLHG